MQVNPTLTAKEFSTLHNAKCELNSIAHSLEGIVNDRLYARFEKALQEIDASLKNAYAQDDAESTKRSEHYDSVGSEIGIRWSVWSVSEVESLYDRHPFVGARYLRYKADDGTFTTEISGDSWASLWKAAEKAIRSSNDNHHIFVEGFHPTDIKSTLELSTGS